MAVPTGQVQIYDGAARIATVNLDSSGNYSFDTSGLAGGSHSMTAKYLGDTNFNPSVSSVVIEIINAPAGPQPSQTSIAVSPNPANEGDDVTISGTVTAA